MKYSFIAPLLLFPFFLIAQNFKGIPSGQEKIHSSQERFEQELLRLVNKERAKRRRKPLKWNDQLMYAARYHAKDMAVDQYFNHDSKDKRKNGSHKKICSAFDRMGKFVDGTIFPRAENIAVGEKSPEEVMKDWMSSKGHRQNILDKETKYIGIAYIYVEDSEWGAYWVQTFGM